ncbi:serine/threonine protein kinase [Chitinimonas sp. BJB300]|uniref:serine/threonine protein kinase n=1 Tax=Chitinimonas sp. BJB300 TaxID=1559339 RepID=UPI000C0FFEE9|nr:serine/threonine protein kinase [Chitinimonas sp. BJB300]PHV13241.1 serine/threonine protein kinase [Chitinimonas sp. BJB300]TSJ89633.1 serine/threonine protein kinase [Chitinimonas sp. BJB300]
MTTHPPYELLTPDCLLDAIDSLGIRTSGSLLALNSYENRVYQVGIDDELPIIAKFYRPARWSDLQILEEHTFVAELAALEIPVVGALTIDEQTLHHRAGFAFSVFPRRGGRTPELDDPAVLEWLGRFLGRIHAVGRARPYVHRPTLDIATFGEEPIAWLLDSDFIPSNLRDSYRQVAEQALAGVRACFVRAGQVEQIRLHGDCHASNVLWTDAGPHFVDFDDSRMGPAMQDLWMLLSGDRSDQIRQMADILAGYEDFCEFNHRELHLIEALRTLRLIHYSAWLARRWGDPAFPQAFSWFGTPHYWEQKILELREQIAQMEEPPLWLV